MISFEQEIKAYFRGKNQAFEDNCRSFKYLDFSFGPRKGDRRFHFDAKEKRHPINLKNWPASSVPQEHLFILDDLAARKVLAFAPNAGLLIRDNTRATYHFFTVIDLFLMPKLRVNRPIENEVHAMKGKWLIDLRNAFTSDSLAASFDAINTYLDRREGIFFQELACYGQFVGETIVEQGSTRRAEHWTIDIESTR